jgi:hypothetical protein
MNTLEERLRAALRETGDEIRPAHLRALQLPEATSGRGRAVRPTGRRRSSLLAAFAAAASVSAIVATSVILASGAHRGTGHRPSPSHPASVTVPPYFLALTGTGYPYYDNPLDAAIRSTATGATLARIKPPAPFGTFTGVTAAADDRTFALAVQPWHPVNTSYADGINSGRVSFVLLRFDPATHSASTHMLRVPPAPAGATVDGMALSPDGTKLAVALQLGQQTEQIRVYTLADDAVRIWTAAAARASIGTAPAQNEIDPRALSWSSDGETLGYAWWGPRTGLGLLDTAAAGNSLLADSRIVAPPHGIGCMGDEQITPDGNAFTCAADWLTAHRAARHVRPRKIMDSPAPGGSTTGIPIGFAMFSARSGALLTVLDKVSYRGTRPMTQQVLWASPTGSGLLVQSPLPYWNRLGLLRAHSISLLPASVRIVVPDVVW